MTNYLSIDPSTGNKDSPVGIVVLDHNERLIYYEAFRVPEGCEWPANVVADRCAEVCAEYLPVAVGIERPHFQQNAQTALVLGYVFGAITHALETYRWYAIQPQAAKNALTAYHKADKRRMIEVARLRYGDAWTMTTKHLKRGTKQVLRPVPEREAIADAIGVCLCAMATYRVEVLKEAK
jgi:Holliday junction resolvasome RuvABC endonuclease subunit